MCDWRYRKMRTQIDRRLQVGLKTEYYFREDEIINETITQLNQYFLCERETFDLPLLMIGTDFQKNVWTELLNIPFGHSATYMQQALKIGDKNSVRAVASANGANAISIIVPCHRIIGSNNELVGYAGGLPAKQKLLQLEKHSIGVVLSSQTTLF